MHVELLIEENGLSDYLKVYTDGSVKDVSSLAGATQKVCLERLSEWTRVLYS